MMGALALASCAPVMGTVDAPIRFAVLTADGGVTFHHSGDQQDVTVSAGVTSPLGSVREAFWPEDPSAWIADQESCMTWDTTALSSTGMSVADPTFHDQAAQPGLAMRIAPAADGKGVRAITVTENVFYSATWLFNVHVWESTNTAEPFVPVGQFDLTPVVGDWVQSGDVIVDRTAPPPWHLCVWTVGDQFSFMVWTGDNPQPAWDDPSRTFTVTLPAGWDYPGYAGGYAGHLHAGQSLEFSDSVSGPLCLFGDARNLPVCQSLTSTPPGTTLEAPTSMTTAPVATSTTVALG